MSLICDLGIAEMEGDRWSPEACPLDMRWRKEDGLGAMELPPKPFSLCVQGGEALLPQELGELPGVREWVEWHRALR